MRPFDSALYQLCNLILGREWPRAIFICACIFAGLRIGGM